MTVRKGDKRPLYGAMRRVKGVVESSQARRSSGA